MMILIAIYALIGVAVVLLRFHLNATHSAFQSDLSEVVDTMNSRLEEIQYPNGLPLTLRLARRITGALIQLVAVFIWPVVVWRIYVTFRDAALHEEPLSEQESFESGLSLVAQLCINQIESLEKPENDGDDVPDLPFGYLNVMWVDFKSKVMPGDELWSFRYSPYKGQPIDEWCNRAEGYLIKRDGEVVEKIIAHAG